MKYTDITTLENYLLIEIDSSFQDQVETWIEQVSEYINNITGRVFIADTTASARYYSGRGNRTLTIDDCVEVTKVEIGTDYYGETLEEVDSDDYVLYPLNYDADGVPIRQIYLKEDYYLKGIKNEKITAKWGYSTSVPTDIELAATIIVSGIIKKQISTDKDIVSEKIGDYSVAYDKSKGLTELDQAKAILEKYTRYYL